MRNAIYRLSSSIQHVSRVALSTWSPGVAGLYDAYLIDSRRHIDDILWYVFLISAALGGGVYIVNITGPKDRALRHTQS